MTTAATMLCFQIVTACLPMSSITIARTARVVCWVVLVTGCATSSDEIVPDPVPSSTYAHYDCSQIAMEEERLARKIGVNREHVDQSASSAVDGQIVAGIFFWPALFFTQQDKDKVHELSAQMGNYDALEVASIEKSCDVTFRTIPPTPS